MGAHQFFNDIVFDCMLLGRFISSTPSVLALVENMVHSAGQHCIRVHASFGE